MRLLNHTQFLCQRSGTSTEPHDPRSGEQAAPCSGEVQRRDGALPCCETLVWFFIGERHFTVALNFPKEENLPFPLAVFA